MRVRAAPAGVVSAPRIVVVGAGIAGLSAARALRRAAPAVDVVVLEASRRVGGLIETERTVDGFLLEHGADCLLTTKPHGLAALDALGLDREIVAGGGARRTYVARGAALVPMPPVLGPVTLGSAVAFARSPLLSWAGKARAMLEPFVPARRSADDESIGDFAGRRFGPEVAHAVLAPLLGGLYGADIDLLSMQACLPRFAALERDDGSVVRGMRHAARIRRRRERAGGVVLPHVVTLRRGMGSLPDAAARGLGVELGVAAVEIHRYGRGFGVATTQGTIACDGVVLATPAWAVPALLAELAPDLAADVATIAHKRLDLVTLAWPRRVAARPLDGTGWVRAAGDRRPTAACTWASEKWPERAPTGALLVRSVLAAADADDAELVAAARRDLRDLLGIAAEPALVRVRRLARATPIYAVGHRRVVDGLRARAAAIGALALAGNAYEGVGVPDCIASGEAAAAAVLRALGSGAAAERGDDEPHERRAELGGIAFGPDGGSRANAGWRPDEGAYGQGG